MDSQGDQLYGIRLQKVWGEKSEDLISEIISRWKALKALPPGVNPRKRASQVVFVARNNEEKIVGITTAVVTRYEPLKNYFFVYRGLVDPSYRVPGLFIRLTTATLKFLESIHREMNPSPIGVFAEVESPQLQKIRDVVTVTGFTLIGFSPRGNPLKVYYFKGARY